MVERKMHVDPELLVRNIENLEPLPVTARMLIEHAGKDDASLASIAEIIEFDQPVAASVLRLASSAMYAGHQPPVTVAAAVVRIGTKHLLDLVMGDYLRKLHADTPLYSMTEDDFWLHGAAARLAALALTKECGREAVPPLAVTASLLHDVGKIVMARSLDAKPEEVADYAASRGVTFDEAERGLFGTDHAAVGAAIARKWRFPDPVLDAIRHHHDPVINNPTPVIDVVVIANFIAKCVSAGLGVEGFNFAVDDGCYRRLGLHAPSFDRVLAQTDLWLRDLRESTEVNQSTA